MGKDIRNLAKQPGAWITAVLCPKGDSCIINTFTRTNSQFSFHNPAQNEKPGALSNFSKLLLEFCNETTAANGAVRGVRAHPAQGRDSPGLGG